MQQANVIGYNADIDTNEEDVISGGGTISFPSSAAATTIVSADANDDGSPAGTGALTARVQGLDSDLNAISEDVTLNGTNAVTLVNQFYRVNLVKILTVGSGGSNAGLISVKHGGTTLLEIPVGANRSQSAFFTAPKTVKSWAIKQIYMGITNAVAGSATFVLYTRKQGEGWQKRWIHPVYGTASADRVIKLEAPIYLDPGEDAKLSAATSGNNTAVSGGFDVLGSSNPL